MKHNINESQHRERVTNDEERVTSRRLTSDERCLWEEERSQKRCFSFESWKTTDWLLVTLTDGCCAVLWRHLS